MGYQPEERYWTDYLRIALPVVGLLLMLGLFWFWAASLIGDEDDDSPGNVAANTPVPTAVATVAGVAPTEVPGGGAAADGAVETATTPPEGDGNAAPADDPGVAGQGNDVTVAAGVAEDPPADEGEEVERQPGEFLEGDPVVTNSDEVRIRSSAEILDDNIVDTLDAGVELVVTGPTEEDADETVWVPVELGSDPEVSGYIASTLIDLSE